MESIIDLIELEPWHHSFYFNKHIYGSGKNIKASKERVAEFYSFFPSSRVVLELGSLEGSDSFILAQKKRTRIVAFEGRTENIKRAEFLRIHYKMNNLSFMNINLDNLKVSDLQIYDSVLCCGVLYHLKEPWTLIEKLSACSNNLYIWTHYWDNLDDFEIKYTYHVKKVEKTYPNKNIPAINNYSYWFTYDSLIQLLKNNGYKVFHKIEKGKLQFNSELFSYVKIIVSKH